MHTTTSNSGILTFVCALSAFFAAIKFFGGASLSWFWVLSPLWITALSVPVLFVIIALRCAYLGVMKCLENRVKPCPAALETV